MIALVYLLWMPIAAVLSGFSLKVWWGWFIATPDGPFHVPHLSVIQALGVSLVVTFLTATRPPDRDEEAGETLMRGIAFGLTMLAVCWCLALIYHAIAAGG